MAQQVQGPLAPKAARRCGFPEGRIRAAMFSLSMSDSHCSKTQNLSHSRPRSAPTFHVETATIRWTCKGAISNWDPVDSQSLDELQRNVQQTMQGSAQVTQDYAQHFFQWVQVDMEAQLCQ